MGGSGLTTGYVRWTSAKVQDRKVAMMLEATILSEGTAEADLKKPWRDGVVSVEAIHD